MSRKRREVVAAPPLVPVDRLREIELLSACMDNLQASVRVLQRQYASYEQRVSQLVADETLGNEEEMFPWLS
jgi:hypothetical protein